MGWEARTAEQQTARAKMREARTRGHGMGTGVARRVVIRALDQVVLLQIQLQDRVLHCGEHESNVLRVYNQHPLIISIFSNACPRY